MEDYKIFACYDSKEAEKINPNFIYNRFDLWELKDASNYVKLFCYESQTEKIMFEVLCFDSYARLGMYLMVLSNIALDRISKFLFNSLNISRITFENTFVAGGGQLVQYNHKYRITEHNHLRIELPETIEELDLRLSSKGRYNIKREKRMIEEAFGGCKVRHLPALDVAALPIWEDYFKYKYITHKIHYGLNAKEYCDKYHVTDVYSLALGQEEKIAAIVLSCEQCPIVYIENLTYDVELGHFSPGQVLYDEYLKKLIEKGFREIYLLGGDYAYKKRYGSIEETVYSGTIYKNTCVKLYYKMNSIWKFGVRKLRNIFKEKVK